MRCRQPFEYRIAVQHKGIAYVDTKHLTCLCTNGCSLQVVICVNICMFAFKHIFIIMFYDLLHITLHNLIVNTII